MGLGAFVAGLLLAETEFLAAKSGYDRAVPGLAARPVLLYDRRRARHRTWFLFRIRDRFCSSPSDWSRQGGDHDVAWLADCFALAAGRLRSGAAARAGRRISLSMLCPRHWRGHVVPGAWPRLMIVVTLRSSAIPVCAALARVRATDVMGRKTSCRTGRPRAGGRVAAGRVIIVGYGSGAGSLETAEAP